MDKNPIDRRICGKIHVSYNLGQNYRPNGVCPRHYSFNQKHGGLEIHSSV